MSFEAVLLEAGFSLEEAQAIIEEFFTEQHEERAEKPLFFCR